MFTFVIIIAKTALVSSSHVLVSSPEEEVEIFPTSVSLALPFFAASFDLYADLVDVMGIKLKLNGPIV